MGKNVCLNFFQSGWWSTDALGCHLIGICSGIGDSLKWHYKYWNKSCCRNESDQTVFCARMSTLTPCGGGWANTTMEITTFAMMLMRDRPEDCYCFYRSCPFLCNWPGMRGLLLFTVGKLIIIILEILQEFVFFFQAYVLVSRSIKQKREDWVAFSRLLSTLLFDLSFSVHCITYMLS